MTMIARLPASTTARSRPRVQAAHATPMPRVAATAGTNAPTLAGGRAGWRGQAGGGGGDDRYFVALGLRGLRIMAARHVDRELGFGRFAAQPFGAIEHERRVPGAAIGGTDRIRAIVRRD